MGKSFKRSAKLLICTLILISTCFIIIEKKKTSKIEVKGFSDENLGSSKVEIKGGKDTNVKVYQKEEKDNEFKEVTQKEESNYVLNSKRTFTLNTEDKESPNNITNIKPNIVENYIVITFDKAKDNGSRYKYYIETDEKSEEKSIYSESGVKGYSYVIDNYKNTEAGYNINKEDNEPILYQGINWNQDYYLHIRTIDNMDNYSDTLTFKINLPSKGIRMQYIDINSNNEISPEEMIIGNANEEYNLSQYKKEIDGYKLIETNGEEQGKLKKERINFKYEYAKNAKINIEYLDRNTGKKIKNAKEIIGHEGKEYNIKPDDIEGYKNDGIIINGKMKYGINNIQIYYDLLGRATAHYIDLNTGDEIIKSERIQDIVGTEYSFTKKEIPGYDFVRCEGREDGNIGTTENKVCYYYKKEANITVKHMDIDSKEVLFEEILNGYVGDKIKVSSKEFEGYVLNEEYKNSKKKITNKKKEEESKKNMRKKSLEKTNLDKEAENIIDELINSEDLGMPENETEEIIENVIKQYDIIMECSNSEYIIYYKKR